MLATLKPVFDKEMSVQGYRIIAQRENYLKNISLVGTGNLDTASDILGIDIVNILKDEAFESYQRIFVEVSNIALFTDFESDVEISPARLVLMVDGSISPTREYTERIEELKDKGYGLAIRGVSGQKLMEFGKVLKLMEFVVLDNEKNDVSAPARVLKKSFPKIKVIADNVSSMEAFITLKDRGECDLYAGSFYAIPVTVKKQDISPVKMTYLRLLNYMNSKDFDLKKASDIISQDPALVISLLKNANRRSRNSDITSIPNAAAMMGQADLKSWAHTAITKELCADKPGEITRLSLVRAQFFKNIAGFFEMKGFASELFLTGLFSVIDVILDVPMEEALSKVHVSDDIRRVLVEHDGPLSPVYDFALAYENGDFQYADREMLIRNIESDEIYKAFIDALKWYRAAFL